MTVQYNSEVASARFVGLLRLLVRWKGSLYKLIWPELLIYLILHFTLTIIYQFVLTKDYQKRSFEKFSTYCDECLSVLPINWILGFYVSQVVTRWQDTFKEIPAPTRLALLLTASLPGQDEVCRLTRRTVVRYVCLGFVLTMVSISPAVKKRFPTLDHITKAGIMQESERSIIDSLHMPYNKYYVPFVWAATLVVKARKLGRIKDDFTVQTMLDEIVDVRGKCQKLFNFDWVNIPLAYTQVATIVVYVYFLGCLLGRQKLDQTPSGGSQTDDKCVVPIFTVFQFLFYMGWLKVAEELMCPFGDDDDDFDVNPIIDKSLEVSYTIVDDMHNETPDLIRDQYWNTQDFEIPYTEAAKHYHKEPVASSTDYIDIAANQLQFVPVPVSPTAESTAANSRDNTVSERFSTRRSNSASKQSDEEKGLAKGL